MRGFLLGVLCHKTTLDSIQSYEWEKAKIQVFIEPTGISIYRVLFACMCHCVVHGVVPRLTISRADVPMRYDARHAHMVPRDLEARRRCGGHSARPGRVELPGVATRRRLELVAATRLWQPQEPTTGSYMSCLRSSPQR